jgi:hypothetical protein
MHKHAPSSQHISINADTQHLVHVAIVHRTRDAILLHGDNAREAVVGRPNLASLG